MLLSSRQPDSTSEVLSCDLRARGPPRASENSGTGVRNQSERCPKTSGILSYAGGARWAELMADAVVCLPADVQPYAQGRLDDALALPAVEPSLVPADLAGHKMRWSDDRRLSGIIDWDWAAAWDPAVDAARLAWHGWATVKAAVDAKTYQRARVRRRTFGIKQIVARHEHGTTLR